MAPPGMLYVTMQPKPRLALDEFHDWYNNEHGPLRLRKPHIFTNGLRYIATDDTHPTFLAIYDVTDMDKLKTPEYTSLRKNRSPREALTIRDIDVTRYFFQLESTKEAPDFVPAEQLSDPAGRVLISVEVTPNEGQGAEAAIIKWCEEEHIDLLTKVPGWLRTRRYSISPLEESSGPRKIITLNEFAKDNGLGGPEHDATMATPRRTETFKHIASATRRMYSLFYVFGPAPRDLHSLSKLDPYPTTMGNTRTLSGPSARIDSFVTTADGLSVPYQLEGNPAPDAPTVAFCNSLLTSLRMWDPFVKIMLAKRPDLRILRYDQRGRYGVPSPPVPATMDQLAKDVATLLGALRISKLHALVGVSLGGATALNFALKFPKKLDRFVACDFNVAGSEANTKAWKDRITIAEGEGMQSLAGQTVERWFHSDTMESKKEVVDWITKMVAENNVEGFKFCCQALWNHDLKPEMGKCGVPGLLVVGEGDGKGALVKAMEGFKGQVGEKGTELKIVPKTGHLPMCEDPQAFWEAVESFI